MESEQSETAIKINRHHLPQGWVWKRLGEITEMVTNGFVGKATDHYTEENGVIYIQGYNVLENAYNLKGIKTVTSEFHAKNRKSHLREGDLLTIQTGDVGLTTIVPKSLIGANCHALIISRFKKALCWPWYYVQYYNSTYGRKSLKSIETGSTMKHLNVGDLIKWEVPLPPLNQQRKIATILSVWDTAIQTADQILKAKQERKRGLMQQLLTGKKRLPSFSGEWCEVKLGDVFQRVQRSNRLNVDEILSISAKKGFVSQTEKFSRVIAGENLTNYTLLKKGEFAYNKGNSDLYPYGCIYKLDSYNEAAVPNVYFCFKSRGDVEEEFYKFYFQNRSLDRQLHKRINSGVRNDGLLNLNANEFFEVKIAYPPLDEQRAIATILNAADVEIKLATAEVEALKQQKRGLIQQLLTGRKLVTVDEHEHQYDLLNSNAV